MGEILFVDTTLRAGHRSLGAENMTTGMMLPIAERMDRAGSGAIEMISKRAIFSSRLGKEATDVVMN